MADGAWGNNFEGRKEAANRGRRRGTGSLGDLGLIFRHVHFPFFGGQTGRGRGGEEGIVLYALGASGAHQQKTIISMNMTLCFLKKLV